MHDDDDDTALVADRLTGMPVFPVGRDRATWFEPEARILRGPVGSFVWPALAVWLAVQSGPRGVPAECEWLFAPFAGDGGEARLRLRLLKDLMFKGGR